MTRFLANPILWVALALLAVINVISTGPQWWNVLAVIVFIAMAAVTRTTATEG